MPKNNNFVATLVVLAVVLAMVGSIRWLKWCLAASILLLVLWAHPWAALALGVVLIATQAAYRSIREEARIW